MSSGQAQESRLVMEMVPLRSIYSVGELPQFRVTFANRGVSPLKFCRYKLDYRLKAAMVAEGVPKGAHFEAQPFVTQSWDPLKQEDIVVLAPGEELTHILKFEDDPVFGFLRRAKQPPVIPVSNAVKGFPKGTFSFNTAVSNQVGLYVGQSGVFDRRLEGRKVPDVWPGVQGCHLGLVEATAKVTFVP